MGCFKIWQYEQQQIPFIHCGLYHLMFEFKKLEGL